MMNDTRKILQTGLLLACLNKGARANRGNIRTAMNAPGGMAPANAPGKAAKANDNPERVQYYYHSDYLGSTSLITNLDGEVVQHVEYLPFGEVFLEERNNRWNTPYLFNAKELDEETGLYYYGARYYDPRTSVWLSTDPCQEKYPNVSTYAYCGNNPINRIDPTGMDWIRHSETDEVAWYKGINKDNTPKGYTYIGEEYEGIKIQTYNALGTETGTKYLEIKIGYKDPNTEKSESYNWVQTVERDSSGKPFVDYDSKNQAGKDNYPYYQDKNENQSSNSTPTPRITLNYGFSVEDGFMTVNPIKVVSPSSYQKQMLKQIK